MGGSREKESAADKLNTDDDPVRFIAVQTVFEGHRFNTSNKLRQNQVRYALKIPMAHAAGHSGTHQVPQIMHDYRSGGTPGPWLSIRPGWWPPMDFISRLTRQRY